MINKNNKRNTYKNHTNVTNYNKFLLTLDKQNNNTSKQISISNKTNNDNKINNDTEKNNKREIKQQVNNINSSFRDNFNNPAFTGITPMQEMLFTLEDTSDPNLYVFSPDNSIANKPQHHNIPSVKQTKVTIVHEVNNIADLLFLIDKYPSSKNVQYNINMEALHKIKRPLTELNNMIGMHYLKQDIVDQIIFYIQNLHTLNSSSSGNDFMHTVIYGPPGTGKTEIAKIIGNIFSKIGVLNKGTFKKVTRSDLIAGYLGQTALKTRDVIKESLGGVLFIDEAYALGHEEKRDSFSKECIDTLCEALSDHKHELMVIIAGYESNLNDSFFSFNPGLQSRFTWRFKTDEYSAEDLYNIFVKKVKEGKWFLSEHSEINIKWFEKNKKHFKFYGRDIETLFAKTKIAHSKRVFLLEKDVKKYLTIKDLDKGLESYIKNNKNEKIEQHHKLINSMYV